MQKRKYSTKLKVCCPNKAHQSKRNGKVYDKLLFAFEADRRRLWLYCNDNKCKRWIRADITETNGIVTKIMPKNYHLDLERMPTLVVED